jgi:DNA-binding MarR family transcriptional regulator
MSVPVEFDENFQPLEHQAFADIESIISEVQSGVLYLVEKNPFVTSQEIADYVKKDVSVVEAAIKSLEKGGLIKVSEVSRNGETAISKEITSEGKKQAKARRPIAQISRMYAYEVRLDIPDSNRVLIDTSREFCVRLIGQRKMFSRADIEAISQSLGYSVWQYRGGFYTNPKTGETTPYCRHRWVEKAIIK